MGSGVCCAQTNDPQRITLLEAVRGSLANNVSVKVQERQLEFAQGALEQATSQFAPTLGASVGFTRDILPTNSLQRAQLNVDVDTLRTDSALYGLTLSQQLRNGWIVGSSLASTRSADTVSQLSGLPAQNVGRLNFSILVPLGKGSGSSAVAGETAAGLEAEATRSDLRHGLSQNVLDTVSAYWGLVVARKNLTIASEGESALGQLRNELQKLIAADERPAAELTLISANLTDKATQRIAAERLVLEAQQALGRSMGVPYTVYSRLAPADDFPAVLPVVDWNAAQTARLTEQAFRDRADLAAARVRRNAAQAIADAARYNLKPKVDLKLNLGYASLNESNGWSGTVWPYSRNPSGPSGGATLTYEWPFSNRSAQAILAQQLAVLDQNELRVADLINTVGAGVEAALSGAIQSSRQLRASVNSLDLYNRTVDNEKTKHRLGQSTLMEVISVNDMLLAARAAHVSYQASYLNFMTRLRFETATLVESAGNQQSITLEQLLTPPMPVKE